MLPFENDLEKSRAAVTDAKARAAQLEIDLEKTDFDFEVTVTVDATVDPPKITKTKTDPVKMHTPEEKIKLMEDFVNGSDDVLDDCNAPNAKSNWQKMKIHGKLGFLEQVQNQCRVPEVLEGCGRYRYG